MTCSTVNRTDYTISIIVLLTSISVLGTVSILLGADGSYDLLNYHFYNGWALFNKPVGYDIAPAQVQTYIHPLMDAIFYQFWRVLNGFPRVLTFVWAIPQAVAVWLAFLLSRTVLAQFGRARTGLAVVSAFIGGGGAVSVGVIGTTMSEGILNTLVFWGALLVLQDWQIGYSWRRLAGAGFLAGSAVGLKLTAAPYLVAFGAATLLAPGFGTTSLRYRRLRAFSVGSVLALAAIGGPWWLMLYLKFGNPVFPFFNAIFHSPDYGPWNYIDDRFLPRTAWQWIFYPLDWALRKSTVVSEVEVRDWRITLALIASFLLLAFRFLGSADRRPSDGAVWCAIWTLCAYGLWLKEFSILRYASGLEVVSGIVIVAALQATLSARAAVGGMRMAAAGLVGIVLLVTTVYPTWNRRTSFDTEFLKVSMPILPSNSTVIFLTGTPSSYLAAFEPATVRFVGVNNNLIHNPVFPDVTFGLMNAVDQAIRTAPGQIWGMEMTGVFPGAAEKSLDRYRLARTSECVPIVSNVLTDERICRLERKE